MVGDEGGGGGGGCVGHTHQPAYSVAACGWLLQVASPDHDHDPTPNPIPAPLPCHCVCRQVVNEYKLKKQLLRDKENQFFGTQYSVHAIVADDDKVAAAAVARACVVVARAKRETNREQERERQRARERERESKRERDRERRALQARCAPPPPPSRCASVHDRHARARPPAQRYVGQRGAHLKPTTSCTALQCNIRTAAAHQGLEEGQSFVMVKAREKIELALKKATAELRKQEVSSTRTHAVRCLRA